MVTATRRRYTMAEEKNEVVEATEATVAEEKAAGKAAPSKNIEKILDSIEKMTVLEMAELVKALEDRFGVTAAAPMAMMAAPAAGGAAASAEDEKTEWDVILSETGEKKFQVVKVIRQVTDLGLKEAKELVDNPGQAVKKGVSKDEAEDVKKKLEEAGAKAELK
jgi:large subunit ribosomal protein L7/L12